MQLISPDYGVATEGGVAPFEEAPLYPRSQRQGVDFRLGSGASTICTTMSPPSSAVPHIVTSVISSTTTTTTATTTTRATTRTSVSNDQENRHPPSSETPPVRPECLNRHQTTCHGTNSSFACDCESGEGDAKDLPCDSCRCSSQQLSNPKKRKFIDSVEEESDVLTHCRINKEKYRRLLLTKRLLLSNLAQRNNVPLFYLYGDLLLIPKYKWGSDVGFGGGRRTSLNDTEYSSSFDLGSNLEGYHHHHHPHPRSSTSSLVQVCPDSLALEESGLGPTWITDILPSVMQDLNRYGVCVVDNFLGSDKAQPILQEVEALHVRGLFEDGQVVSPNVQDQARGIIRGDKITWVTGNEPQCANIRRLVSAVDSIIAKANHHQDAGQLSKYSITWRSRAMVACYPGQGSRYVKHVDNPDGDGRCITAIYYINKDWTPEGGGVLRIYPEGNSQVAEIEPLFDRMLFFWSDRRNPHEVLPANVTSRYAITLWYYDQKEREEYLSRASASTAST